MNSTPHPSEVARERLSVLMDGEFRERDAEEAFKAVIGQEAMAEDWAVYHCIGDVLRSDDMGCHSARMARSVGERLRIEPHLVAPIGRGGGSRGALMRPLSALAAVAAVTAVGVVAWPQLAGRDAPVVAAKAPMVVPVPVTAVRGAVPVSSEYLAAHRQYSAGPALRGSFAPQGQTVAFESSR